MLSMVACHNALPTTSDPYGPGPYGVESFAPKVDMQSWNLRAFYPAPSNAGNTNSTSLPVFLMVTGFHTPVLPYTDFLTMLASHGVIAVGVGWQLTAGVNYTKLASHLTPGLEYVTGGGLANDLSTRGTHGVPIADRIIMGGQSEGNHVFVRRLTTFGCGAVGGAVMIDPVDGADPFGIVKEFVIHPPAPVNFVTPALHIETGLDPKSAGLLRPPCAPASMSNGRFFDAWQGPIWQLNATAFGHIDICDIPTDTKSSGFLCPGNGDSAQVAQYHLTAAAVVASFIRGVLGVDNFSTGLLEGRSKPPINIEYAKRNTPTQVHASCTSA